MSDVNGTQFRHNKPLVIVIAGTSGAGKDTVIKELRTRGQPFHFVVTATSRLPRRGEVDGVDYIFVSKARFEEMIERDELIEYAIVYNEYKGVPKDQVQQALASEKDVILRLDVQGAATIRKIYPDSVLIFLTWENQAEAQGRLEGRLTETRETLETRLQMAQEEYNRLDEYDYVVVNQQGQLNETVNTVISIIRAEHHRVRRCKE